MKNPLKMDSESRRQGVHVLLRILILILVRAQSGPSGAYQDRNLRAATADRKDDTHRAWARFYTRKLHSYALVINASLT